MPHTLETHDTVELNVQQESSVALSGFQFFIFPLLNLSPTLFQMCFDIYLEGGCMNDGEGTEKFDRQRFFLRVKK